MHLIRIFDQYLRSENREIKFLEQGLGQILAVAAFINDIEVIGNSGANIGFRIMKDLKGNEYAQTIKIDPNCEFDLIKSNFSKERRTIRVTSPEMISPKAALIHFDNLPSGTKIEFLTTIQKILSTSRQKLREMFVREGAHYFLNEFKLAADEAVDFLIKRQFGLESEYREDIVKELNTYLQKEENLDDLVGPKVQKITVKKSDKFFASKKESVDSNESGL